MAPAGGCRRIDELRAAARGIVARQGRPQRKSKRIQGRQAAREATLEGGSVDVAVGIGQEAKIAENRDDGTRSTKAAVEKDPVIAVLAPRDVVGADANPVRFSLADAFRSRA